MASFLYNLLVFSPSLLLAAGVLYLLENYGRPPPPQATLHLDGEAEEGEIVVPSFLEPSGDEDDENFDDEEDRQLEEEEGDAAPVAPTGPQPLRTSRTRVVGPKKARSLAARDRRRAYHEFLQAQAQQREEAEEALREEEEARAFENARRRYQLEDEIAARKKVEREERAKREREEKEKEARDAAKVVKVMKVGKPVVLKDLAARLGRNEEWVSKIAKRERFIGTMEDGAVGMVTKKGVWVKFDKEMTKKLLEILAEKGRMEWREIADVMGELLQGKR